MPAPVLVAGLGYSIGETQSAYGLIVGTKLAHGVISVEVMVRPVPGQKAVIVRATFQESEPRIGARLAGGEKMDDAALYQVVLRNWPSLPSSLHMGFNRTTRLLCGMALLAALAACQLNSRDQVLETANTQVAQRAISTRSFDTGNEAKVFQAVLATLQDLGFVVDRADTVLGTISATKYGAALMRFTVTIRTEGTSRTVVRASGELNQHELSDPAPFQQFFEALSEAPFLQANTAD